MKATSTFLTIVFAIISVLVSILSAMQIWGYTLGVVFKAVYAIFFFFVVQCLLFYGITKTECSLPSYKVPKSTHKVMIYYLSTVFTLIVFTLLYIMFNTDKRDPEAGPAAVLTIIFFSFIWPKKDKIENILHCDTLSLTKKKKNEHLNLITLQEVTKAKEHHHSHHHHHHSREEKKDTEVVQKHKEKKTSSRYCHCPFCGTKIHSDSIYCKYCGKKI